MPLTWTYEPVLNAFIALSTDPEPLDGLFQALDEILKHPNGTGRLRILVDHRHPPTPAMVGEGITRLLPYLLRIRGSTIVLVLPGEGDFGIGRLATLMLGGAVDIEVFNDMEAAVVSLTMDEYD
ncbi:MAG: hypothetical protein M3N43_13120 [Actinomycetota bacterium]|nr:hypothetical protein [Actinomycetota bacterium]